MAKNDWEHDDLDIFWASHNVYKKIKTVLLPYLPTNLFKHTC